MKIPEKAPTLKQLMEEKSSSFLDILMKSGKTDDSEYLHWDTLRRKPMPPGFTHAEEWWLAIKLSRSPSYRKIGSFLDKNGAPFVFSLPDSVLKEVDWITANAGAMVATDENELLHSEQRDRYLLSSLIEEAVTSSLLEGAATTREAARELLDSGRNPKTSAEKMVLNNYRAMQLILRHRQDPLTPEFVLDLQRVLTEDQPDLAGRFRRPDEEIVVGNNEEIYHRPPAAESLGERLEKLCRFANEEDTDTTGYVSPVLRAIILHFWLAYDHPFKDGNGRTARVLFYWRMLKNGHWLFEYLSISDILVKAPAAYAKAFLHTETDENDLTYFIVHQLDVIRRSVENLQTHLLRRKEEVRRADRAFSGDTRLNHRQREFLEFLNRHPGRRVSITECANRNKVSYATAYIDLEGLAKFGYLHREKSGRKAIYGAVSGGPEGLQGLNK